MAHVRREIFHIDRSERVGERLKVDGRISRVGVQIYTDKSGGSRREYRPPEEVFSQESLDSLKSMPITIQHPSTGMVTRDNYRRLNVGHVGEDVRKDSDNTHVLATLWILDGRAIEQVESGKLTELSVGYWASLDAQSGTTPNGEKYDAVQTNIVGNHLALLEAGQARGGPSLRMVLDANDNVIMASEIKEERNIMKIRVDGVDYDTENEALAQAIEKERQGLIERADRSEKERDELKAKTESLEDQIVSMQKKLDKASDPERITQIATARAELINDAKKLAPEHQFTGSDHEIRKAALEQSGIKLSLDSEDYVAARFEAALENLEKADNESLKNARKSTSVKADSKSNSNSHPGVHLDRGLTGWR